MILKGICSDQICQISSTTDFSIIGFDLNLTLVFGLVTEFLNYSKKNKSHSFVKHEPESVFELIMLIA